VHVNIVKIQSQPFQKRGSNFLTFVLFRVLATFRGFLGLWQPQKVKLQLADAREATLQVHLDSGATSGLGSQGVETHHKVIDLLQSQPLTN